MGEGGNDLTCRVCKRSSILLSYTGPCWRPKLLLEFEISLKFRAFIKGRKKCTILAPYLHLSVLGSLWRCFTFSHWFWFWYFDGAGIPITKSKSTHVVQKQFLFFQEHWEVFMHPSYSCHLHISVVRSGRGLLYHLPF